MLLDPLKDGVSKRGFIVAVLYGRDRHGEFLDIRFGILLDHSSVLGLHVGSADYDAGLLVRLDESTADGDAPSTPVC